MRRYEKYSQQQIIAFLQAMGISQSIPACSYCPIKQFCGNKKYKNKSDCIRTALDWLSQDIQTKKVPRIAAINTVEDWDRVIQEFKTYCSLMKCKKCAYKEGDCLGSFMKELIEVEECQLI